MESFEKREPKIEEGIREKETMEKAAIVGFEKFDCSNRFTGEKIEGKEILEKAAEALPTGLCWENIKRIEYRDEAMPTDAKYGLKKSFLAARYNEMEKSLTFYRIPWLSRKKYISLFRETLLHEWAHSIDPELLEQKDLSEHEKNETLIEWRKIRREESQFSLYVKEIKNKNKRVEESLKRDEDFADTVALFLSNPGQLCEEAPKRFWFMNDLVKKRFPEFSLEKQLEKAEQWQSFVSLIP